jgi:hypothetical protein
VAARGPEGSQGLHGTKRGCGGLPGRQRVAGDYLGPQTTVWILGDLSRSRQAASGHGRPQEAMRGMRDHEGSQGIMRGHNGPQGATRGHEEMWEDVGGREGWKVVAGDCVGIGASDFYDVSHLYWYLP